MVESVSARRKGDLVVCIESGDDGSFIIKDANDEFCHRFRYSLHDIIGKAFSGFVSKEVAEVLLEITSGDSIFDVCDILPRIAEFSILDSNNALSQVKVKIFRVYSENVNSECYEIVMRDASDAERFFFYKRKNKLSSVFEKNSSGEFMVSGAIIAEVDFLVDFLKSEKGSANVVIGIVFPDVASNFSGVYVHTIANSLVSSLRGSDVCGALKSGAVVFVLFGCFMSSATGVIARIFEHVSEKLAAEKSVTVSLSYADLSMFEDSQSVISSLMNSVDSSRAEGGSKVSLCRKRV